MAKTRSPNYPSLNLETAIEKAQTLFGHIGRHPAGFSVAVGHLGYSANSSSGRTTIAALRAFGLLDAAEGESESMVRMSPRGLDIVADFPVGHPDRRAAIQAAALAPKLHQELRTRYGASLPSEDEIKRFLVREREFNDNTVAQFIAEYKETIAFAGLDVDQNAGNDGSGQQLEEDHRQQQKPPKPTERRMAPGTKEDVFSLDEGAVVLQWPQRLSRTSAQEPSGLACFNRPQDPTRRHL